MMYQASVGELRRGRITRTDGHVAIVMRHYPRGLAKSHAHEYLKALAPEDSLFEDFRAALERSGDHDRAFESVAYEERFDVSAEGRTELVRLCEIARSRDVYLVCQCERGEKCHRHLLLLMAREWFGTTIDRIGPSYPVFEERLRSGRLR